MSTSSDVVEHGGSYVQHFTEPPASDVSKDAPVTTLVREDGIIDLLFDEGAKLSVDLGASHRCSASALLWQGYISVRYGRETTPEECPEPVTSIPAFGARHAVAFTVAEALSSGSKPENVFVARLVDSYYGFEIVNEDEVIDDTFSDGALVTDADSEAEAVRRFKAFLEWSSQRFFSIHESKVFLSGKVSSTKEIADRVREDKLGWFLI